MVPLTEVIFLLVAYQVKHYLCDFPFQTSYMLGKFKPGWDWVLPLTAHCSVHALGTALVVLCYGFVFGTNIDPIMIGLDFGCHFVMDRIKASPNLLGRYEAMSKTEFIDLMTFEAKHGEDDEGRRRKRNNVLFWWAMGADQSWHHLTHYAIIVLLLINAHP